MTPFCLGTDCKSLYDLCNKVGSIPQEKRVALELMDVREGIEAFGDKIRWVPTDHMLVDCMTKFMPPPVMLSYLKTGKYSFKYDNEIKNTKREDAKARKIIRDQKLGITHLSIKEQKKEIHRRRELLLPQSERKPTPVGVQPKNKWEVDEKGNFTTPGLGTGW